jgi:pimeloyl-ACP methyl ester carboxylesterase
MLIYLHGFASGPASTKARAFADRFPGLVVPDLNLGPGGFERLTITRILAAVDALVAGARPGEPIVLFGSSLGGYSAALWQARRGRAAGLVLLAPAFDLAARWRANPPRGGVAREAGRSVRVFHHREQRELPFDEEGFLTDAARYEAFPSVAAPTLVQHGSDDMVVPVALAREFITREPRARLVVYEAGHELAEVVPVVVDEAAAFVAALGAPAVAS